MKKIMIKHNSKWKEMVSVAMLKEHDASLGYQYDTDEFEDIKLVNEPEDLLTITGKINNNETRFLPKKDTDYEGCPCCSEPEEECEHEGEKNFFRPQFCRKCGKEFIYADPAIYRVEPKQKIKRWNLTDPWLSEFQDKINELIDLLNSKE